MSEARKPSVTFEVDGDNVITFVNGTYVGYVRWIPRGKHYGFIGRGNLQSYLQLIPTDIVKVMKAVYSPAVERYEQLFGENRLLS